MRPAILLLAAVALAGCGGGGGEKTATKQEPVRTETGPAWDSSAPPTTTGPTAPAARGVKLDVPRGWARPKPPRSDRVWPKPATVLSSFHIARLPANAACPKSVLESFPPDGVYVLVAEYTKPRPPGFPAPGRLGPRPDLGKLDLRPAEVECWDAGLSGAADFTENGRAFRVEVLLGPKVTKAQRRRALDTLASLRISGA